MATGTLTITNTSFPDESTADGSEVITNFNDIVNFVENRNDGTDEWKICNVTATATAAMTISGNQATTLVQINNTATDGDPVLQFALGGTVGFSMGTDDGASDAFKCGLAAIGTTTWLQVPSSGLAVQFPDGTDTLPGITFISDPDTGIFNSVANTIDFSTAGAVKWRINATGGLVIDSTDNAGGVILTGNSGASAPSYSFNISGRSDDGIFSQATSAVAIATAGVETARFDASATATHTRFLIFDVDNATLERVTVGDADSGGTNFKLLRIPN